MHLFPFLMIQKAKAPEKTQNERIDKLEKKVEKLWKKI